MVTWAGSFQGRRFLGCHFLDTTDLTAKFVVSCCAYCKLRRDFGFFCSVNHFSEGGVKANHNVTSSPSLAENDFRLFKNSEANHNSWWVDFLSKEGVRRCFIFASDKNKKDQKNLRLLPETGWSQSNKPWNTKQTKRIEIHQSRITNHDLLNLCK